MLDKCEKATLVLAFSWLALAVFRIPQNARGYNVSLYQQLPTEIIIGGAGLLVGSIVMVTSATYRREYRRAVFALSPMLAVLLTLGFLPQLLGYVTTSGDLLSKIGTTGNILQTHNLPDVIYPGLHSTVATTALVSGLDVRTSFKLFGLLMLSGFILNTAVFLRRLKIPVGSALLVLPFIFSLNAVPAVYTYSVFFPLVVYTWYRTARTSGALNWSLTTVILLALLWIHHPMPSIMLVIFLPLTIVLSRRELSVTNYFPRIRADSTDRSPWLYTAFLGAGFLWAIHTVIFYRGVRTFSAMLGLRQRSVTATITKGDLFILRNEFGMNTYEILLFMLKRQGDLLALGLLLGAAVIAALFSRIRQKPFVALTVVVIVPFVGLWSTIDFVVNLAPNIQFLRFLRPAIYLSPILCGFLVEYGLERLRTSRIDRGRLIAVAMATLLLSGPMLITVGNFYKSPWVLQNNNYIVESDVEGMDWYFSNKNRETETTVLWRGIDRYGLLLLSSEEQERRKGELNLNESASEYRVPENFGGKGRLYDQTGRTYYLESKSERLLMVSVYEGWDIFTRADFERLKSDPSVNRIYTNGNQNVSLVRG